MPTFRRKPIELEAFQLNKSGIHPPSWFLNAMQEKRIVVISMDGPCFISTLEGTMRAECLDWIVKSAKGELWPVKPDIFELTYEPVTEQKDTTWYP